MRSNFPRFFFSLDLKGSVYVRNWLQIISGVWSRGNCIFKWWSHVNYRVRVYADKWSNVLGGRRSRYHFSSSRARQTKSENAFNQPHSRYEWMTCSRLPTDHWSHSSRKQIAAWFEWIQAGAWPALNFPINYEGRANCKLLFLNK